MIQRLISRCTSAATRGVQQLEGWSPTFLLLDVGRSIGRHQVGDMAASLSYYALLAIFPLLLAVISGLSFFLDEAAIRHELQTLTTEYLPGAEDLVTRNIDTIIGLRGAVGLVALIGLIWTSSAMFGAITRILDRVWGVVEPHAFHIARARSLTMVLAVGILVAVSLVSTTFLQVAEGLGDVNSFGIFSLLLASGARLLLQGSSLIGSILIPALLYRYAPSERIQWRDVLPGAVLSGLFFEIAKTVFLFYLTRFGRLDLVYGSVASVIVLLIWVYISGFILILGAEFGAALRRRRWAQTVPFDQTETEDHSD